MVHLHVEAVFSMGAPREIVFEALANEFNDWAVGKYSESDKIIKKEGNSVEREVVRKIWGVTVRYKERDELTPPSKIVMLAEGGRIQSTFTVTFEPEPDGSTKVAGEVEAELKGALARVAGPLAKRRLHHNFVNGGEKFAQYKGWNFRVIKSSSG